jgi:hypothetical protein
VCCDGQKIACIFGIGKLRRWYPNPVAIKIIKKCVFEHEFDHFDDTNDCPQFCGHLKRMGWAIGKDHDLEECNAYTREWKCLNEGSVDCGTDSNCRDQVHDHMDAVGVERAKHCGAAIDSENKRKLGY